MRGGERTREKGERVRIVNCFCYFIRPRFTHARLPGNCWTAGTRVYVTLHMVSMCYIHASCRGVHGMYVISVPNAHRGGWDCTGRTRTWWARRQRTSTRPSFTWLAARQPSSSPTSVSAPSRPSRCRPHPFSLASPSRSEASSPLPSPLPLLFPPLPSEAFVVSSSTL